ncbi:MAG: TIGR03960 family B12-binding radical SAM protein [Nitrospinota bacterium]|nr:TIGR03960 family B12-binding radical SAM protein [Nitrospinota bacterium]
MIDHPYARWLDKIHNPSQYIGEEVNSIIKVREAVDCRLAICFPELYGIGMSNLGVKILYSAVNERKTLWAERFFAPEPDFEQILRNENVALRSHESHDPLSDFDVIGFSIPTELCYSEILAMLELGKVPLLGSERGDDDPIVIGGGPSIFNPEPISDFFDMFFIGEAEILLPEICETIGRLRKANVPKDKILEEVAKVEGIYVPSHFSVLYDGIKVAEVTHLKKNLPKPIKYFLSDLNNSPYPFKMVIPYGQPVFDRLSVEIDRGCTVGCRYCQAGITYRPVRERAPSEVLRIAEYGMKSTGFDNISLASLSSGDYSSIEPLVKTLMDEMEKQHVAISLPSLRSGSLTRDMIDTISRVRKTGFTITAEAGNERLRWVINKNISDDEIIDTARKVLSGGWTTLKMYFMIGLPTETDEDVYSIPEMVKKIVSLSENGKRFKSINVGVAQFVPKPHTAFQWVAMDSFETLLRKKTILIGAFRKMKKVSMKGHEVEMSFLEGVFSRGDRRLGAVIKKAYEKGCRLDGWSDYFRYDLWLEAFAECGIKPEEYANRKRQQDETLPWDHINVGVNKKYLLRELALSEKGEISEDCRNNKCLGCGMNKEHKIIAKSETFPLPSAVYKRVDNEKLHHFRLHFRKAGLSKYLSHLELKSAITRALKRGGLPVAYSEGFHPHPKLSFGPALSVGVESHYELLDLALEENMPPEYILKTINMNFEKGLEVYQVNKLLPPFSSIQSEIKSATYEVLLSEESGNKVFEPLLRVLMEMDGVEILEKSESMDFIKFESVHLGILTRIRKVLPDFSLGPDVRLVKTGISLEKPMKKAGV